MNPQIAERGETLCLYVIMYDIFLNIRLVLDNCFLGIQHIYILESYNDMGTLLYHAQQRKLRMTVQYEDIYKDCP